MKIGLAAALVVLLVLPTLIVMSGFYILARFTISDEVTGLLEKTLNQKAANLGQWLDDLENDTRAVASFSQIGSLLQHRERSGETIGQELENLFAEVKRVYGDCYTGFFVYDTTGRLVYPADPAHDQLEDTCVLRTLLGGKTLLVEKASDSESVPLSLWLCAPIGIAEERRLGVLTARINPAMLSRVFSDPRPLVSAKAYLIDSQHRAITPLYSPPGQIPVGAFKSEGITLALAGQTGVKRYEDHRGVEVLGAYTFLPSPGWGLVIEQDYDEAFAGLRRLRGSIFILLGAVAAASIVFSLITANWIAQRLEQRDRRAAERSEQLIAADKLATAGIMAASVAHEINNPLTTINVLIHNLYEETPLDEPERMDLNIALDEIAKIKNIILRFLEFARPQEPEFSKVDVNEILHRFCRLLHHHAQAKEIKIVEQLAEDVLPVYADPSHIGQVFLSILLNAIEATPVQGTIELSTSVVEGCVRVRVFNTGPELEADLYEKIFEPFYSTKAQGTGLGLSIARTIVERHGGRVTTAAVPGKGMEFIITLNIENYGTNHG